MTRWLDISQRNKQLNMNMANTANSKVFKLTQDEISWNVPIKKPRQVIVERSFYICLICFNILAVVALIVCGVVFSLYFFLAKENNGTDEGTQLVGNTEGNLYSTNPDTGIYGPVCYDNFGLSEAHVACKEMGFIGAERITKGSSYGSVNNQFSFSGVRCSGDENSMRDCLYNKITNCKSKKVAGTVCSNGPTDSDTSLVQASTNPQKIDAKIIIPTTAASATVKSTSKSHLVWSWQTLLPNATITKNRNATIKCLVCSSETDPFCNDPISNNTSERAAIYERFITTCGDDYNICSKTIYALPSETKTVVRTCGNVPDNGYNSCISPPKNLLNATFCICNTIGCNGAQVKTISSGMMVLMFSFMLA